MPAKMTPQKIKALRRKLSLTQVELAALLDVYHLTISRWERGEITPSVENQEKLRELGAAATDKETAKRLLKKIKKKPKKPPSKTIRVEISIPANKEKLVERLGRISAQEEKSRSVLVVEALQHYLKLSRRRRPPYPKKVPVGTSRLELSIPVDQHALMDRVAVEGQTRSTVILHALETWFRTKKRKQP